MILTLTHTGSAQLEDEHERILWASDTDHQFKDEFGDEFLSEDDIEEIFEYLVDNDIVEDDDVENIEIYEESLENGKERLGMGPGDEDDEDDDEE